MSIDVVTYIINKAIEVTLLTSLPSVGLGLLAGLIVAIFQAVTQIQEQTLTFVPKMIVVLLVLGATFAWTMTMFMEMTLELWNNIPIYSK